MKVSYIISYFSAKKAWVFASLLAFVISIQAQVKDNPELLAKTYNQMGQSEKVLKISSNSPDFLFEKAQASYQLGQTRQALNILHSLDHKTNHLINFRVAACYARLNQPDSACLYLMLYLQQPYKISMAEIQSETAFETIAKSKPWKQLWETEWYNTLDNQLAEANYLIKANKKTDALFLLDEVCAKRKNDHQAYALKARIYYEEGNFGDAQTAIDKAIEQDKKNAGYYYLQSLIGIQKNQPRKALNAIDQAIALDHTQFDYYRAKANILHKNNQDTLAFTLLNELLEVFPTNDSLLKTATTIYSESGEYILALKALNKLMATQDNPNLYVLRADIYFNAKSWDLALKDYSMWLDFRPDDGRVYYQMGWCCQKLQQYTLACDYWKRARRFNYLNADKVLLEQCR
jgi:tetratricopeptide (TPR) repeat protein